MKAPLTGNTYIQGFVTVEILIAFAIIILCMSAVIMIAYGNQLITIDAELSIEAISKAQRMLEDARARSKQNFYSVVAIPTTSENIFQKTLNVEDIDLDTKKITSQVTWSTGGGRNPVVAFTTLVTNFKNICSQSLVGDWVHPQVINTSTIDIDTTSSLTGLSSTNGYTYITADASTANKKDFYVVNTSNPVLPILIGSLTTGPGLSAVSVSGNYAYVANSSINAQLQVVDITTKNNPTLYKSFKLPITDSDGGTVGYSVLYHQGKVYLSTKKNGKAGLHIIDVSDLSNIRELGYLEVNNTINHIQVSGDYAYIASDDNTEELRVLNISNPASITNASIYNPSNTSGFGYGSRIFISGNSLFLGRTFDSNTNNKELYVLDIAKPTLSPLPSLLSQKISSSVHGVVVKDSLVFLATNSQFQVRKISDLSLLSSLPLMSNSVSMDCQGNYLYMGVLGDAGGTHKNVLKIIASSP